MFVSMNVSFKKIGPPIFAEQGFGWMVKWTLRMLESMPQKEEMLSIEEQWQFSGLIFSESALKVYLKYLNSFNISLIRLQ